MKKTNMNSENSENKKGILQYLNKLSFGVLRAELVVMVGVIGICVVKAGSLFLI